MSVVSVTGLTIMIVVRVAASHVSQSLGVCGWSPKSGVWQIGQHPSWALSSHRLVLLIGRTDRFLRRAHMTPPRHRRLSSSQPSRSANERAEPALPSGLYLSSCSTLFRTEYGFNAHWAYNASNSDAPRRVDRNEYQKAN